MFPSKKRSYVNFNKSSDFNNISNLNKKEGVNTLTKYKYSKKVQFNNNFPEKKDRSSSKCPRPQNIKNVFESQIVFC